MRERLLIWLSSRMPRGLVYWCAIRLFVHATVGRYSGQVVPELTALEALRRWDNKVIWNQAYNTDGEVREVDQFQQFR